jgi:hypothetical protein
MLNQGDPQALNCRTRKEKPAAPKGAAGPNFPLLRNLELDVEPRAEITARIARRLAYYDVAGPRPGPHVF